MNKRISELTCWVVSEGMAGTENQCIGVAEALGMTPEIKRIKLRQPWKSLSPWLGVEQENSFLPPLRGPWPDLVIASGRKAIAAARFIKKQSRGKAFTVYLQDPRISPSNFDLVAVPFHDKARGPNVIVTDGAPNRITPAKLDAARDQFAEEFSGLAKPKLGILIGGNSKTHTMTKAMITKLASDLHALSAEYDMMITASRRTPEEFQKMLRAALPGVYFWDGRGDNPYFGILAYADVLLVTEDSASMLSDAGTTGKPVYKIALQGGSPRFDKLYGHLQEIGAVRPFDGEIARWSYPPLNDSGKVAAAIAKALE